VNITLPTFCGFIGFRQWYLTSAQQT